MQLTGLRIVGFKTFVEPAEVEFRPGLTGIVGPNGCGKSNLVEALRWVMGESSHKNMRASGMDDVIFSGSGTRPARNSAEVMLTVDNESRTAPAAFNDADVLQVTRRIEREHGSTYRLNGREVRARDVQILFADAATGARSPALVRQGQISELIGAKPQARRRILEDAAGVAGLAARRHEAELRLRHAEENLVRVEDVLREIGQQADGLRRQGRQAARYRALSAAIRRTEALLAAAAYRRAAVEADAAGEAARADLAAVAAAQTEQAAAATRQAVAAHALGPLREAEAGAAAGLRRLVGRRHELDGEERRLAERRDALAARLVETGRDLARQEGALRDAEASLARAEAEAASLGEPDGTDEPRRHALAEARAAADETLAAAEATLLGLESEAASRAARFGAAETARAQDADRLARLRRDYAAAAETLAAQSGVTPADSDPAPALAAAEAEAHRADELAAASRLALQTAREREAVLRGEFGRADRAAGETETEHRTLLRLFAKAPTGRTRLLDEVAVEPGFEVALGAALGDDLDVASTDPAAPAHWRVADGAGDPALPPEARPLAGAVRGPPALARRLAQIGLVDREAGDGLAGSLRPGQRLVSREGDLWRWDGFVSRAEAPNAAARRLAERNRLDDLARRAGETRAAADALRSGLHEAEVAAREGQRAEGEALDRSRAARRAFDAAQAASLAWQRREAERAAQVASLAQALARLDRDVAEAADRVAQTEANLAALGPVEGGAADLEAARVAARAARREAGDAAGALAAYTAGLEATARRRKAVAEERARSAERVAAADRTRRDLVDRLAATERDKAELDAAPDAFLLRRRALSNEIAAAEGERRQAADRLAAAETDSAEADRAARATLETLAAARERRAASQIRAEAATARVEELGLGIVDAFETAPAALLAETGLAGDASLPDLAATEAELAGLRADRERLGGVNLRAEDELAETEAKAEGLARERDDLGEAIKRLRQAIGSLNRDGRERLLAAFHAVNGHFGRLFGTLFGGGEAAIALVESDDPLEAGLEITARPPGKKPQTLLLLSGGEQALTATALIFAVFLTNPSPICVLDEVDAPLDDANVERYCDLLRAMVAETRTRFVVITHNPVTMARMDRLFGVTMRERGVSQLVSVDLERAERMREAG